MHLVFEPCMRGDLYQLMTRQHGKLQEAFVACQVRNHKAACSPRLALGRDSGKLPPNTYKIFDTTTDNS